jgi:hypothetical protein
MNTRVPLPPLGNVYGSQSGLKSSKISVEESVISATKILLSPREREMEGAEENTKTLKDKKKMGENNKFLESIL